MAFDQTRFSLMVFPQGIDNQDVLTLHIVFIPRNINPLKPVNTLFNPQQKALAFSKADPEFIIRIANDPDKFPGNNPANERSVSPSQAIQYSATRTEIYKTLRDAKDDQGKPKYFDIDDQRSADANPNSKHRAPKATKASDIALRKYLPNSYRQAFNFTSPRTPNAVTDDSYHCAMRAETPLKPFQADTQVSWGKVYAYLLRQPLLARQAGLIYEIKVTLDAGDFEQGGWLYADLKPGSVYADEQQNSLAHPEGPFIKSYAARMPLHKTGEARSLFAAVLFPVMKPGQVPDGVYDELFLEAAKYQRGFTQIVHASQPVSGNNLQEEQDGFHPQKDGGIRLGWDDEQILIWYLRQLTEDPAIGKRLDAPLGVAGYAVDVREFNDPALPWESLNRVQSQGNLMLEQIPVGAFQGELPYSVYPSKVYDGTQDVTQYWLPMYFASWNHQSLVLPDKTAAEIYQHKVSSQNPVTLSDTYTTPLLQTTLLYGRSYEFRVRCIDISGGGPSAETASVNEQPDSHIAKAAFKRYVAPNNLRMDENELRENTDDINFKGEKLLLKRPLLGYPAVLYTGKYAQPVQKLTQAVKDLLDLQASTQGLAQRKGASAFGIADPDVNQVQICVEVETLKMDNLISKSGRENYITLYETSRQWAAFTENTADIDLEIPIRFIDVPVINLGDTLQPFPSASDNACITANNGEIVLPTARNIRITLRALGDDLVNYWGNPTDKNPDYNTRVGKSTVLTLRRESQQEVDLFDDTENPQTLQGIYLQPDPETIKLDPIVFRSLQGSGSSIPPAIQRLASQLNLHAKGLTIQATKGEQIQFWCSSRIRHSMAPDNSSITFSSRQELQHQWLVCTQLTLHRDWSWDSLDPLSFFIERKQVPGKQSDTFVQKNYAMIGDLELKRIASFTAVQEGKDKKIHREKTRIILIDVLDNTPASGNFPDTLHIQYRITPRFIQEPSPVHDQPFETRELVLPVTTNPVQSPKLIGAGIALSPYNRNSKYSATEPRTRYLWLEFDQAPADPNDALFARVLTYSPDQLLSNNHPSLMRIPEEPALNLDPEYTRVVSPDSAEDHNGLESMQRMEKSIDTDRHYYLLPLPPGVHPESAELFGMYTYEFRYGHSEKIWSTAQARFGRPLRVTGLQHPAPNLNCMVQRTTTEISINAPYAESVFEGKNVRANPPRTQLWALLYAQVRQADGLDYRNILLGEKLLRPVPPRNRKQLIQELQKDFELRVKEAKMKKLPPPVWNPEAASIQALQMIASQKESLQQGFGNWSQQEVSERLRLYGLPLDASLSVLCVEVYGQIQHAWEHIDKFSEQRQELVNKTATVFNTQVAQSLARELDGAQQPKAQPTVDPLNSQLGLHRILRTSPLTEVPFICCPDCN